MSELLLGASVTVDCSGGSHGDDNDHAANDHDQAVSAGDDEGGKGGPHSNNSAGHDNDEEEDGMRALPMLENGRKHDRQFVQDLFLMATHTSTTMKLLLIVLTLNPKP